jgi:nucleoside 2-deoxyribosyltransferase
MNQPNEIPLLVGEVFVDLSITPPGKQNKLRLGGIVHAARAFWALDKRFSAAVILPSYLEDIARSYLTALGCVEFYVLGRVRGAPNVIVIQDATEVSDQGYEALLREEKVVELSAIDLAALKCEDILIFPGTYDLASVCEGLPKTAVLHLDVAYDLADPAMLAKLPQTVRTVLISTSSPLFAPIANNGIKGVIESFKACSSATVILKENRGGARMVVDASTNIVSLPAQLGSTVNSVGVGDVFAATYVTFSNRGYVEAGWRASYAAAAYSQTTYPDLFRTYVQRDLKLTIEEMNELWGVFLPWEKRREYAIYLAAPDFSYADRRAIDRAVTSLTYHNFVVRRPVVENGELPSGSEGALLEYTYKADCTLLKNCAIVFAVPTGRDPGTLVEVGIALEANIPVVVYDPAGENRNTMVMAGAQHYSADLDSCLNSVFRILSEVQAK